MSRRKINRFAKDFKSEGKIFGFEFDDIIVGRRSISAEGDIAGIAETDILINFNSKGKATRILIGADYYDINARLVQDWQFSNYKKFGKAIVSKKHEKDYTKAVNYLGNGTERGLQRGIDMIEDIPGITNLTYTLFNFDNGKTQAWT
tara:strand:- start:144 stop:584 length:441 start_codon:yes stop_codon:yes gene_type:complete